MSRRNTVDVSLPSLKSFRPSWRTPCLGQSIMPARDREHEDQNKAFHLYAVQFKSVGLSHATHEYQQRRYS